MIGRSEDGWVATTEPEVRAVLGDERFGVAEVPPSTEVGTIAWLRASVSRFANGPEHRRRRALALAELARVDPDRLRVAAYEQAGALLRAAHIDVAHRAPTAALADLLGLPDPAAATDAVIDCAAGYFPGADAEDEARADRGTKALLELLDGVRLDVAIARITLLVQGCAATATLIESAIAHRRPIPALLREHPPVLAIRRVARTDVELGGAHIRAGDTVVCDIGAASDPATLTFGAGHRPCPASTHAIAAACGVLDALSR
jgi:cytochrome P450